MMSAIGVIYRENMFVKVSNQQYHALPSSPGDAKNLDCRLATFHGESVNKLKGQIGVALKGQIGVVLILKYFWWIFASEDKNFHFNKKYIYLNKTN